MDNAKRSFYRAVNGIFRKIGKTASEDVEDREQRVYCLSYCLK